MQGEQQSWQPDSFQAIAGDIVEQYITDISLHTKNSGQPPNYEELYNRARELNQELTFKAVKLISRIKRETDDYTDDMLNSYQSIILNAIVGFVSKINYRPA